VGNKAAVFPLQLLGFDVDIINSVQFSNHTGYPFGFEGEVLDGSMLEKLVNGLERNGLLSSSCDGSSNSDDSTTGRIGHILTGYIGSESFLRAVVNVVTKLKQLNPHCRYICDPVLGDLGRFYVPKELVDIYKKNVLPLADVITPNQFEIEQLTGISIQSIQDAQNACCILHDIGVSTVLITSIVIEGEKCTDIEELKPPPDSIGMFASRRQKQVDSDRTDEQYILYAPRLDGQFTGTGDITAALFLAYTAERDGAVDGGSHLAYSLEKLGGTMNAIVQRTANAASKKKPASDIQKATIVCSRELQLIQSRDDILNPKQKFRALKVETKRRL
jgi:pyridoxine kinase